MSRRQAHYELQRNELLYKAAQFSSFHNVDMAVVMSTPQNTALRFATSGTTDATFKRLQQLPAEQAYTRDQVIQNHMTGSLPIPHQGGPGQWSLVGRQGAWVQLMAPSGQTVQLPALRPPGFLDRAHCPVPHNCEQLYSSLTQELDRLCDMATAAKRRRLAEGSGAAGSGAQGAGSGGQNGPAAGDAGTSKPSRFKALSVEVPQQTVLTVRPVGQAQGNGPATLDLAAEGMGSPSPGVFLTSAPQSLGGGLNFTLNPSPRNPDLLVAGQLGRLPEGAGAHLAGSTRGLLSDGGHGELPELATPNSSMALNGFMASFSPRTSNGQGGRNPGGFTDDPDNEEAQEVEGAADLVVQGKSVSKAALQALDSKASVVQGADEGNRADANGGGAGGVGAAGGSSVEVKQEGGEKAHEGGDTENPAPPAAMNGSAIDIPIDIA